MSLYRWSQLPEDSKHSSVQLFLDATSHSCTLDVSISFLWLWYFFSHFYFLMSLCMCSCGGCTCVQVCVHVCEGQRTTSSSFHVSIVGDSHSVRAGWLAVSPRELCASTYPALDNKLLPPHQAFCMWVHRTELGSSGFTRGALSWLSHFPHSLPCPVF